MSFLLYFNLIIITLVLIKYGILYNTQYNTIKVIKSVIVPTIVNEQKYYYQKVNYYNYTYFQLLRSNDYISNVINEIGNWSECEEMYDICMAGKKNGVFIYFGANMVHVLFYLLKPE